MPIHQQIPQFGRLSTNRQSCRKTINAVQSAVRRRLKKDWSRYTSSPGPDTLRFHRLEHLLSDSIDIEVKHFGIHPDETLKQLRSLLSSFRYDYTLQYLPGWIAGSLSLKCGQMRRAAEFWWRQTDVTSQASNELWTRCWMEVLSLLGVEELVKEELLNGLSMPVFREGIKKMPIIPYAKDARGYLVSVGTKTIPTLPNCYICVETPPIDNFCANTLDHVNEAVRRLWSEPPVASLGFTVPSYDIPVELLQEMGQIVGLWDQQRFRYSKKQYGRLLQVACGDAESWFSESINSTIAVPVVCVEDQGGRIGPLNVNVVRQGEEFALEVQADDPNVFDWISEIAKQPVEHWEGDYKVRWGWYSFANTDDSIV